MQILEIVIGVILGGILAWQEYRLRKIEKLLKYTPQIPAPPMEAAREARLIEQWKRELLRYPVGSPKHTAYKNRLVEKGVISGD